MGNWFADKLGGQQQQPPRPAGQQPPVQPGHPGYSTNPQYVPGVWHTAQQAPPQQYQQPQQPGQYGAPGMPQQVNFQGRPQQFSSFTPDGAMVADDGHVAVLYDTAVFFGQQGGSEQVRTHTERCPGCGKNTLAIIDSDDRGNKLINRDGSPRISRVCMECNWPIQQSANILAGRKVKSKGRTKPARQLSDDHVVTVWDQGVRLDYQPQPH